MSILPGLSATCEHGFPIAHPCQFCRADAGAERERANLHALMAANRAGSFPPPEGRAGFAGGTDPDGVPVPGRSSRLAGNARVLPPGVNPCVLGPATTARSLPRSLDKWHYPGRDETGARRPAPTTLADSRVPCRRARRLHRRGDDADGWIRRLTTQPEQAPSVAADLLASVATDETYPPDIRSAAAQLALIGRAMGNGATWAVIGRTLGISGREAKKRAHGLREKVKRAVAA